jgi:hypothetical protein
VNTDISALHHQIIRGLLDTGACPSNADLCQLFGVEEPVLHDRLRQLADAHGVVLDPHEPRPWVIHPFSLTPTATCVESSTHTWWAPCVWCGLGVATLAGGDVRLHTRVGGESEPVVITLKDGQTVNGNQCCTHFAIRPRDAWNNVHAHCAMLLPFHSPRDAAAWASRHRLPFGEVISLEQTADLARRWYGRHADPDWKKWTIQEAQGIFQAVGLRSDFWQLGGGAGRF